MIAAKSGARFSSVSVWPPGSAMVRTAAPGMSAGDRLRLAPHGAILVRRHDLEHGRGRPDRRVASAEVVGEVCPVERGRAVGQQLVQGHVAHDPPLRRGTADSQQGPVPPDGTEPGERGCPVGQFGEWRRDGLLEIGLHDGQDCLVAQRAVRDEAVALPREHQAIHPLRPAPSERSRDLVAGVQAIQMAALHAQPIQHGRGTLGQLLDRRARR